MKELVIRMGTDDDIPGVLSLIKELADYEKALDQVSLSDSQMIKDGFGENPWYQFLVATVDDQLVGLSLFYPRYSTWKGKGLYLEDLVVTQSHRAQGIGEKLFLATAKIARERGCTGLYWQVLHWNTPAIDFYKKWGAAFDNEWINGKLDQKSLKAL